MSAFLSTGIVAGVLSLLSAVSIMFGKPAIGTFLSDPATAVQAQAAITGVLAVVAGVAKGWKDSAS